MIKQQIPIKQTTLKNDPGKTPAIIGLVLAFVGAGLIGLILSIIGYKKSKTAGVKNRIAIAGIIINAISLIILPISFILIMSATTDLFNDTVAEVNTDKSRSSAQTVARIADAYYTENYSYPKIKDDFSNNPYINLPSDTTFDSLSKAPASNTASRHRYVRYQTCASGGGYNVAYWDYTTNKITASPITAGSQTNCVTVLN